MKKHFDESEHPRGAKGTPLGGKFVKKTNYAGEHIIEIMDSAKPKKVSSKPSISDESQFWVDPKGTVIQVVSHDAAANEMLGTVDDNNQSGERALLEKGFVRLKYTPSYEHIHQR